MSQEDPTRWPVRATDSEFGVGSTDPGLPLPEADPELPLPAVFDVFGQTRPGFCARCDAAAPADTRFCPSCRSYVAAPDVGKLASGKRRLAAAWIDSMLRDGGLFGSLLSPIILRSGAGFAVVSVISAIYWAFSLYLWSKGTTPAKNLLRMTVITEDGEPAGFFRMAFRETIGKWFSMAVLGLGLLAIPFDKEKQGWHDKFFGTWVVFDDEP